MDTLTDPTVIRLIFGVAIGLSLELSRRTYNDLRELRGRLDRYFEVKAAEAEKKGRR